MAEGVVDLLELVEVDAVDRHRFTPRDRLHGPGDPLLERRAVQEAGQGVVVEQVGNLRFAFLADDGVGPEHLDRVRHGPDLVPPVPTGDVHAGVAAREHRHRVRHLPDRPRQAAPHREGPGRDRADQGDQRAQRDAEDQAGRPGFLVLGGFEPVRKAHLDLAQEVDPLRRRLEPRRPVDGLRLLAGRRGSELPHPLDVRVQRVGELRLQDRALVVGRVGLERF